MKIQNIIVLLVLASSNLFAQQKNFIDQPYLETTATKETFVIPDRIYLSIQISERDTKGKISVEELEQQMNTKLKEIGIDTSKKLFLSDISSNFKKHLLRSKDVLKNKNYTLLVHDAVCAAKAMVALEEMNISNVRIDRIAYSKIESLKLELKQKAMLKAKSQAELLVTSLGQQIKRAIYISDQNPVNYNQHDLFNNNQHLEEVVVTGLGSSSKRKFVDINFKKIKVSSTVAVKFAIE